MVVVLIFLYSLQLLILMDRICLRCRTFLHFYLFEFHYGAYFYLCYTNFNTIIAHTEINNRTMHMIHQPRYHIGRGAGHHLPVATTTSTLTNTATNVEDDMLLTSKLASLTPSSADAQSLKTLVDSVLKVLESFMGYVCLVFSNVLFVVYFFCLFLFLLSIVYFMRLTNSISEHNRPLQVALPHYLQELVHQ